MSLTIRKRLERNDIEDQIYIGMMVEKMESSEIGAYVNELLEGVDRATKLESRQRSDMPADRFLGRLEATDSIRNEMALMVQQKDQLLEQKRDDNRVKSAEESDE